MVSPRVRVLIAVALLGVVAGGCGALAFGYWETSRDCSGWVDAHGYQLVRDEWWAKTRGCVALTPAREEVYHDEEFRSKAIGWAWQFAIFGAGTLPAVIIVASGTLRWRRSSFREDP